MVPPFFAPATAGALRPDAGASRVRSGVFVHGGQETAFQPGAALCAPAGPLLVSVIALRILYAIDRAGSTGKFTTKDTKSGVRFVSFVSFVVTVRSLTERRRSFILWVEYSI